MSTRHAVVATYEYDRNGRLTGIKRDCATDPGAGWPCPDEIRRALADAEQRQTARGRQ